MSAGVLLSFALASLALTALTAIGTIVLHEFSRHELEEYCRRRRREELFGEILDRHEEVALGVESLRVLVTVILVVSGFWWALRRSGADLEPQWAEVAGAIALGALVLLAATVWLPWAIVRLWSAPFLYHTWRVWVMVSLVFWPLAASTRLVEVILRRLADRHDDEETEEEAFEEEIRAIVEEGIRDGVLEAEARDMIEGVIELGAVDVADIMTPRSRIDAVEVSMGWAEMLEIIGQAGRARIPVYEQNLDNVLGILYVKDLLPELARPEAERRSVRDYLRPAVFVPMTKPVDDLLREFLQKHTHIALVVDEYQAVAGLVTIEDILEEIVGEIVDEHDIVEQEEILRVDDDTAEVLGHAHLDDVNELLGIELPSDEEFDTIAGLVLSRLGRVPTAGESVQVDDVRITVLEATPRRVERVRIHVLESARQDVSAE